jgi:hypothetical protein
VVEPLSGEDLRAVEEVEEAGHAALVHGPLVILGAHRHHVLLFLCVSLRLPDGLFLCFPLGVLAGGALWVPRSPRPTLPLLGAF